MRRAILLAGAALMLPLFVVALGAMEDLPSEIPNGLAAQLFGGGDCGSKAYTNGGCGKTKPEQKHCVATAGVRLADKGSYVEKGSDPCSDDGTTDCGSAKTEKKCDE